MKSPPSGDAFAAEAHAFRQRRFERLTAPGGWLAQVGRYPLAPGDNVLPIGVAALRDGVVSFTAAPGIDVRCAGQPVRHRLLAPDEPGPPDSLTHAGRTYELVRRGDFFAIRVRDPESLLRRTFPGTKWYPPAEAWRVEARFVPYDPPRVIDVPHDLGFVLLRPCPGAVLFQADEREHRLDVLLDDDRRRLFILFADETNRDETYQAGRFLYAPLPDGDHAVIDFNRALNPACAFSEHVTCPLPPRENRLSLRVKAGERRFVSSTAAAPAG